MTSPKILTLDIETAPLSGYFWQVGEQYVGIEQISDDWSLLAVAAKWLDESRIIYHDTGGRGARRVRTDKKLLGHIWKLLDEADVVIAQNGDRFDIKKINARLIVQGFKPYSPIRTIDTYKLAKKHFGFTSNKLAWTSEILTDAPKLDHRVFPGIELWKECLKDNPAAWAEMRRYNVRDVVATEKKYLKMRPWAANHPNVAAYSNGTEHQCPKCGSDKVQRRGVSVSQAGRYPRFQCTYCGGWSKGKSQLLDKAKRSALLVSQ